MSKNSRRRLCAADIYHTTAVFLFYKFFNKKNIIN